MGFVENTMIGSGDVEGFGEGDSDDAGDGDGDDFGARCLLCGFGLGHTASTFVHVGPVMAFKSFDTGSVTK